MSTGSYTSSSITADQIFGGIDQFKQARNQAFLQGAVNPAVKAIGAKPMATARIVKVFIADPNENIPLDKRVIYSGQEQLTDLTDQELFFDVPISELLAKHNELRKTTLDKKQADKFGRDVFLEPARIRDLKMVVVSVAEF
jgi:hypothetical protein